MAEPETYDELLGEIYGPRRELIKAFRFFEGRVNSKRLFDEADAPRQSKHHYLSTLEDLGLIEHVDEEHGGHGGQAFVWQLTPRGEQVADDVVDEETTTISDLATIEERLADLERRQEAEDVVDYEQVEANAAAIEKLDKDIGEIMAKIDTIAARANGPTPNGQ